MIKSTNILKARAGGRQKLEGSDRDREIESVIIVTTPQSKGMKSRKRKREIEKLSSPSVDAVSESGNGRRFQTSEGRLEKGFDEWTNMGSGCWHRMDLERTSSYWQTSVQRPS